MGKAKMLGYQKNGPANAKAAPPYWAVKRGPDTLCHGTKETFPESNKRKMVKQDGYRLTVEGKIWRDAGG